LSADADRQARLRTAAPAIVFALIIFAVSAIPGREMPGLPFWSFDKVLHAAEFGLFAALLYRAFIRPRPIWRPFLGTVLIAVAWGFLDEIHQLFVPGRNCDPGDFFADALGAVVVASVLAFIRRRRS
jgi:VanZ family protein